MGMAIISLSVPVLAASLVVLLLYIWSSSTSVISGNKCDSACFNNFHTQPNTSEIQHVNNSEIQLVSHVNNSNIPLVSHVNNSWSWTNHEIERQMKVQRSWQSSSISNPTSCEGRGIYVYELPTKFNKDLVAHECGNMMTWLDFCKYLSNGGFGEAVEELGPGWHNTNQFTLEPIFHARVLSHRCRVRRWRDAVLFYVPFYAGLDLTRRDLARDPNRVKDSLALELLSWLGRRDPWRRNSGRDHVFVLGKMTWEFRRLEGKTWGSNFQELPQMQNPIKLLIERQPWEINDVGVPYPTFFHPRTDKDITNWQRKVTVSPRKSVVGFAGAARPESTENIRSVLLEQCTSDAKCKFLDCAKEGCNRAKTIPLFFAESEFCLQPPGDSPTRKSFFDSLISGCIPVVFDPYTAYYQYPWHLPQDWSKYSVFIDQREVRNKSVDVVQILTKIPLKTREDMRNYIIYQLMPGLLYGDPRSQFHHFQDAFSITMDSLIGRLTTFNTS